MHRSAVLALVLVLLSSCASKQARLDAAWERFQHDHAAVLARAETTREIVVAHAQATGDESQLVAFSKPPTSPISRALTVSCAAALAYMAGDLGALARAQTALEDCDDELTELEHRAGAAR